jgi:hypothetical protein
MGIFVVEVTCKCKFVFVVTMSHFYPVIVESAGATLMQAFVFHPIKSMQHEASPWKITSRKKHKNGKPVYFTFYDG